MRNRAERRHNDWKKAARKRRIDLDTTMENGWCAINNPEGLYKGLYSLQYDNLHQYSKNKIHCSCGMCSRWRKTNNHGRKRKISGNYAPSKNWSVRDERRIEEMQDQILDNE